MKKVLSNIFRSSKDLADSKKDKSSSRETVKATNTAVTATSSPRLPSTSSARLPTTSSPRLPSTSSARLPTTSSPRLPSTQTATSPNDAAAVASPTKAVSSKSNMLPISSEVLRNALQGASITSNAITKSHEYVLKKKLGGGNYGIVKSALQKSTGGIVAIKVIDKQRMQGREERVKIELEILAKVHHKNILGLMDWWIGAKHIYMVTELIQGGELFERIIQKGSFFEHEAVVITATLLSAVGYLHGLGIVHRDLKPENILLRDKDDLDFSTLVIADFGVSKIINDQKPFLKTTIGSPGYIAPEVLGKRLYGNEVDIWSIGVITFIILSGHVPYHADNLAQELDVILSNSISFENPVWDKISANAKDLIINCLRVDPNQRFSCETALQHPWITGKKSTVPENLLPAVKYGLENALKFNGTEDDYREHRGSVSSFGSGFSNASANSNSSFDNIAS